MTDETDKIQQNIDESLDKFETEKAEYTRGMPESAKDQLRARLAQLRSDLERGFGPETALGSWSPERPSTGHCALVSIALQRTLGGQLVSAEVDGTSHWFNRIHWDGEQLDVDITGDQFERPLLQVAPAGELYPDTKLRQASALNAETIRRWALFVGRMMSHEAP